MHDCVDSTQRQALLTAEDFLLDLGSINAACHQLTSPGVFIQCITNETFVEFFSGAAFGHLGHCADHDALPVDVLSETFGAPLTPAEGFRGIERHNATVTLYEFFDH
ncbi:hypothetical protein D9M69_373400 [compost metagenome]